MSKGDKRSEIIEAALDLFAEQGFHGAPMAMIAERAGVGAGTIYRYFENRDLLITELYREVEGRLRAALLEGYEADKTFRERFLSLGTALLRYFIETPRDFSYLEQFHNSPYGVAVRRDKLLGNRCSGCDVFHELFEEGVTRKVIKDLPLVVLFAIAFGPLLAVARDHILAFITLDERLINRTVEACWDAVKR